MIITESGGKAEIFSGQAVRMIADNCPTEKQACGKIDGWQINLLNSVYFCR